MNTFWQGEGFGIVKYREANMEKGFLMSVFVSLTSTSV